MPPQLPEQDVLNALPFAQISPNAQRDRLKELAVVFSKLGAIAFGGPAAHIAMMDDEVVQKRRWMSQARLLDLLGVTNLIPGPNSTELAIHIGYEYGGWRGLLVAGTCFILPAMLIVWILAAVYVQYQTVPQVEWLLYGIKPVIIAIVVQALWKLGQKAIKDIPTTIAGIGVIAAFVVGVHEILLLLVAGVGVMLMKNWRRSRSLGAFFLIPSSSLLVQAPITAPATAAAPGILNIFLFFLKTGAVLYGSGYVLLAFLQRDLVERSQWLTSQQLLDAVAIGQITPGPVFTTATFVGYLLGGNWGAIAATVGIFLPAFVLILIINPWVSKLRSSPWASGFLDGVNAASLGLMAVVTYTLTQAALIDPLTLIIALLGAIAVFRLKINSAWLVLGGGLMGVSAKLMGWV